MLPDVSKLETKTIIDSFLFETIMSLLIEPDLLIDSKILSGAGDGARNGQQKASKKRTPVSSSKRFATRNIQPKSETVKRKLEDSLKELATPKRPTIVQKKALTVAEITPTRTMFRNR